MTRGLQRLDHVALFVAGREAIADFAVAHLGMHVIERTERFTLIGQHARYGKLTLFEAESPRERGALEAIGLRVNDLARAVSMLPPGYQEEFEIGEGLRVRLVEADTDQDYDLDHVALTAADPGAAAAAWQALGFGPASARDGATRVEVAGAFLEVSAGAPSETERPLLNHIGVLVESAVDWQVAAEAAGAKVLDVVDGANTYAVFVSGPEQVKLEYVEHKPGFSLE